MNKTAAAEISPAVTRIAVVAHHLLLNPSPNCPEWGGGVKLLLIRCDEDWPESVSALCVYVQLQPQRLVNLIKVYCYGFKRLQVERACIYHYAESNEDTLTGLAHLHELGIIYQDLKPQNVLIRKDSIYIRAKVMGVRVDKYPCHFAMNETRDVDLFSFGFKVVEWTLVDEEEETDIQWNMVMMAYRTQRKMRTNINFNKPSLGKKIGFDKSKTAYEVKTQEFGVHESKYPPLPDDMKDNVCSKACLDEVKHCKTYSLIVKYRFSA
ncbi:hypothetical protein QVD17_12346 [Tagetes erecta]|uniref:Protein kinase domain-containing protein n=1 Tax=Tagetes erecta TaxID=13708 RepID=A0AAD8P2S5_TARER|nr:hypothetical protein QVD17_12346 [Tagetes erecta]